MPTQGFERKRGRRSERGYILVLVLFAASLVLLILMSTLVATQLSGRTIARQLMSQGQALNAAQSGLNETLSWFVRQPQQPVKTFAPAKETDGVCTHDPKHNPPAIETENPDEGLVRTYEIMDRTRLWGRYSVRKKIVADVSKRRGKTQVGTIWQLESEGMVFVRNDAKQEPGKGPNTILSRRTLRTEIQRLGLQLPAAAALNVIRGDNANIAKAGRIVGGKSGIGIAYPASTGVPKINGVVTGSPATATTNGSFALKDIFSVSPQELIAMADVVVDDEKDLPDELPQMGLIIIRGNATFSPQRRLIGSGILVVFGNLILNPQSDTFFNGVIYVGGTFSMAPPCSISGSVIAQGNANLIGGSDVAELNYDPAMIDQLRLQMGNYLFSRPPYLVENRN